MILTKADFKSFFSIQLNKKSFIKLFLKIKQFGTLAKAKILILRIY